MRDLELVIIDDDSPDNTSEIVARYDDPRIRYVRNPHNLGPEANWNRCLEEARGRYFKLMPQDDLLYPDALKCQVALLEEDHAGRLALVFGSRNVINSAGRVITVRGYPGGREGVICSRELMRRCVRYGTNLIGEPGAVLMRKSLAVRVGPFDASIPYVIDLDYWVRLLEHGDAFYIANPLAAFRISSGSWSVAIGSRQSSEYRRFIAKIASNAQFGVSAVDVLVGNFASRVNNILRLLFYRFALRSEVGS